jgi:hypothetical protein
MSVLRSTHSDPTLPGHSVPPLLQSCVHCPAVQVSVAPAGAAGHAYSQLPQLCTSFSRSAHPFGQATSFVGHPPPELLELLELPEPLELPALPAPPSDAPALASPPPASAACAPLEDPLPPSVS